MTPERWQQISRIFKSAILLDNEARSAYVASQCGRDDSLRVEVEKLIDSHGKADADEFMHGVAAEDAAPLLTDDEIGPRHDLLNKGQQFGSYIILDSLGSGGMGEVYLARDTRLDRTVALKVLSPDISQDKRRMQRFHQEARVASSLNQPNILTVFEFGEVDGLTFLATEFIDGETLRDHLHSKRLKVSEIVDISIQVLAALDAAHEARIVHRDIKPENVMLRRRDGVVKVLDFGLAKVTEQKYSTLGHDSDPEAITEFRTAPGVIMGTINYMSPEQAKASEIDERTDVWSMGVIMYEMVTGKLPFRGSTTSHTIVQILEKDPVPLTKLVKAPVELERIVMKAIAKKPVERYQTAKDMLADLRGLQKRLEMEAELEQTSPLVTPDEPGLAAKKKRVLVFAVVGMLLVTAAIFAVNIWRSSRSTGSPSVTTPVVERTLTYWITVQKFKDNNPYQDPFTLAGEINFEAGYRIRVNVRSPQQGYLYILNEGPASGAPEYNIVFPTPSANKGSSLLQPRQMVQIPEKSWLRFDAQQGVEKLWLVFSENALPELDSLKQFASVETGGLITDPLRNKAIKDYLDSQTSKPEVEKGETLTTLKGAGQLLVYAIRLEHH
ncbi:MAG TPA: protein kinase [Pyrinomonadaceae bacterium]